MIWIPAMVKETVELGVYEYGVDVMRGKDNPTSGRRKAIPV
jgi:hypothetical protein